MDHRHKLAWASKHIDALNDAIDVFVESDPYVLSVNYDAAQSSYIAWISQASETPEEWSLRIGDIVHNLRSALDTLIYALAVKNLERTPNADEVKVLQFVITDSLDGWTSQSYRLASVHPNVKEAVYGFQPCHRTDKNVRHALSVLRDLSNLDKHRHILTTIGCASSSGIALEGPGIESGTILTGYVGPIVKDTVIQRWTLVGFPPGTEGQVYVRGKLGLDIEFRESIATPGRGSVMGFLRSLHDFIRDKVFPPLEELLK